MTPRSPQPSTASTSSSCTAASGRAAVINHTEPHSLSPSVRLPRNRPHPRCPCGVMLEFVATRGTGLRFTSRSARPPTRPRRRSSKVIAPVARWVFFLGCLLALYYFIVAFDPELLRWLLARLHR